MKPRDVVMRCLKARFMSWVNSGTVPAIIPTIDGGGVVIAVYVNGKYTEPQVIHVPNSPAEMWGPDGPVNMGNPDNPGEGNNDQKGNDDKPE